MSFEIIVLVTTSGLVGLIILFNARRRGSVERRLVPRRVIEDRRFHERGRRALDCSNVGSVEDNRTVRRCGLTTRREHLRRKEDRLSVKEKKISP